jgi:hypothetical protein
LPAEPIDRHLDGDLDLETVSRIGAIQTEVSAHEPVIELFLPLKQRA